MNSRSIPIIDAHHHLWNIQQNYIPWLCDDPPIDFRYGNYQAIRRNYLLEDFQQDHAKFNLIGSIYVESEWDPTDPIGETRWLHDLAENKNIPNAMVAHAYLDHDNVDKVLQAQAQFPLVRSIRHKPTVAANRHTIIQGKPGSMSDPKWRRGFQLLEQYGLSFDLQAPWWHFGEATELAADFPDTLIIVNHTGLPADRSIDGINGWHTMMKQLAEQSNVVLKISGLGQIHHPWTIESNGFIIQEAIRIFGVDRCMFASNFPVDSLVASYTQIYDGFLQITADMSKIDRLKLFCTNAQRFYHI